MSALPVKSLFSRSALPNVLIVGDSISIGYTPFVKKILEGKANVWHSAGNAQHTGTGALKIEDWLGEGSWDVIHFNWGLWDLCYRNDQGKKDMMNGTITMTLKDYKRNLNDIVHILGRTGACLIWATTTPVPAGEPGRIQGSEMKYNKAAGKIMKKKDIRINDLHGFIFNESYKYQIKQGDVHFNWEGYQKLGEKVAESITKCLDI